MVEPLFISIVYNGAMLLPAFKALDDDSGTDLHWKTRARIFLLCIHKGLQATKLEYQDGEWWEAPDWETRFNAAELGVQFCPLDDEMRRVLLALALATKEEARRAQKVS